MTLDTAAPTASPLDSGFEVALLCDNDVVRDHIERLLRRDGFNVGAVARSLDELASAMPARSPSVALVAIQASRGQTLDALERWRAVLPELPVVSVWPAGQRREDQRVLAAGIDAVLTEDHLDGSLAATLHAVRAGIVCFPRRVATVERDYGLSNREKQVLGMLVMGFTNAEIGRRLFLAESTVKSHLSSAYEKLGVRSRKDAAWRILDPDEGLGTAVLALSGT